MISGISQGQSALLSDPCPFFFFFLVFIFINLTVIFSVNILYSFMKVSFKKLQKSVSEPSPRCLETYGLLYGTGYAIFIRILMNTHRDWWA